MGLTFAVDDIKVDDFLAFSRRIYINLEDYIQPHCGVCRARHKLLRTHSVTIHFDAESEDFLDDQILWAIVHEEEYYDGS